MIYFGESNFTHLQKQSYWVSSRGLFIICIDKTVQPRPRPLQIGSLKNNWTDLSLWMYTSYPLFQKRSGIFTESHFKIMHQSILSTNISGNPRVLHLNSSRVPGFVPSELPRGCLIKVLYIIKVPCCQLIPHECTFQLQTDLPSIAALLLQNLFQSLGMGTQNIKYGTLPEARGYDFDSFQFFLRFDFCKIPKFWCQSTGKAD